MASVLPFTYQSAISGFRIEKRWKLAFELLTPLYTLKQLGRYVTVFALLFTSKFDSCENRVEIALLNHYIKDDDCEILKSLKLKLAPNTKVQLLVIVTDQPFETTFEIGVELNECCVPQCYKYTNPNLLPLLVKTVNETITCTNKLKVLEGLLTLYLKCRDIFQHVEFSKDDKCKVTQTSTQIHLITSYVSKIRTLADDSIVLIEKGKLLCNSLSDFTSSVTNDLPEERSTAEYACVCFDAHGTSLKSDSDTSSSSSSESHSSKSHSSKSHSSCGSTGSHSSSSSSKSSSSKSSSKSHPSSSSCSKSSYSSSSSSQRSADIIYEEDECINRKYTNYVLHELQEFKENVAKVPVQ